MSMKRNSLKKREVGTRKRKSILLLSTEGHNQTEVKYFKDFARDKNKVLRFAPGNYTDPVQMARSLVQEAEKIELGEEPEDHAYCLVDADVDPAKNEKLQQAQKMLEKNNFSLIISAPCFEIWFLCHFDKSTKKYISNSSVIDDLKKQCPSYSKSTSGMYQRLSSNTQTAIDNAKDLEDRCIRAGYMKYTVEYAPSTEVYKLAEELLK